MTIEIKTIEDLNTLIQDTDNTTFIEVKSVNVFGVNKIFARRIKVSQLTSKVKVTSTQTTKETVEFCRKCDRSENSCYCTS